MQSNSEEDLEYERNVESFKMKRLITNLDNMKG
jgi:hypothetical protein